MKKFIFVMPLMAVSLLASCGGGPKTTWAVKMKVTANENEVISFDCGVKDTFTVNWGDGTTNSEKSHTYAAGTYDIQINNQLETFTYTSENRDSILELEVNDLLSTGEHSFENCTKLTNVKFNKSTSIRKIEDSSFDTCTQLTTVNLEDCAYLYEIGDDAFYDCASLTSIVIPAAITEIKEGVFSNTGLQTVDLTNASELETIGKAAFSHCYNLTTIKIPNSIRRIGRSVFEKCDSLQYNTKNNIKYLGNDDKPYLIAMETADEKQSSSYILDENCRIICSELFFRCTNLTSITIPNGVVTIGVNAFKYCTKLEIVNFESDSILEIIDDSAFRNCYALTSIAIPNHVNYIGASTFLSCTSLAEISIPNSVNYIGTRAFSNCNLSSFNQKNNVNYLGDNLNPYVVVMGVSDGKQSTDYTLDEGCKIIYDDAFEYCSNLTSIIIPNKIGSIGSGSFKFCSSLTSITIPDSVTSIDTSAFDTCANLSSITLPNNLSLIKNNTFCECTSLVSIVIPGSVIRLESRVFYDCSQLSVVDLTALKTVPTVYERSEIFDGCSDSLKLYVTHEMIDYFKSAKGWNEYADKITDEPVPTQHYIAQ